MNIPRKWLRPILMLLVSATVLVWVRYYWVHRGQWQPVAEGVVFARNFMLPDDPAFQKLPDSLSLGDARAKPAPTWWLKVAKDLGLEDTPADLPLVFCGDLAAPGGRVLTVVAQLNHKFSGDGFYRPGPELWLKVVAVERLQAFSHPVLVSEISRP